MSIIRSIIEWTEKDLLEWQSDAVRRLLTQDKLTEEDELEILSMVKNKWGLNSGKTVTPILLQKRDVSSFGSKATKITLKSMNALHNVNAIPDGSGLLFGHKGLTVIYGENGAGKSGYARIMKRACKARDSKERILPNVFKDNKSSVAQAEFRISVNEGPDEKVLWKDNENIESPLSYINVFDSRSATIIVDGNNEVIYLPLGAHVFEELVKLLKSLRDKLEKEKPTLKPLEYKDIGIYTQVGEAIAAINHNTTEESIESLALWTKADEEKLSKLGNEKAELELYEPEKQAKVIRRFKGRIKSLKDKIELLKSTFSIEKEKELNSLIHNYKTAQMASKQIILEGDIELPLEGFKNSEWQILYKAARDFSLKWAYKDKDYPVIDDDSKCVLCMQPLSGGAKERFTFFKEFMENTTKQHEELALKKINTIESALSKIEIPPIDSIKDLLDELRDIDEKIAVKTEAFLISIESRANKMILMAKNKQEINFATMELNPKEELQKVGESLEAKAKEKEKGVNPKVLDNIKREISELESRKLFVQRKGDILHYVQQVKEIHQYDNCIGELQTTGITRKGSRIVSGALTPTLNKTLEKEIEKLGANHLLLGLKSSGSGGETKHQIQLQENQTKKKMKLSEVLSEGEQRIVALSGFFAELELGQHECPIVFDDPVSSLDHRYREKIARRLVEESLNRQVVVFTHDISLLLALEKNSVDLGAYFLPQTLHRSGKIAGDVIQGNPWHAMSVSKRIGYLKNKMAKLKKYYSIDKRVFNQGASEIYGLLRESWEALIEEILFNETIYRHSPEVQTQRLREVEVTTEDYKTIDFNMKKCSKWMIGHDTSEALDINRPSPEEIMDHLKNIEDFRENLIKRKKELKKEREAILKPKKSPVG